MLSCSGTGKGGESIYGQYFEDELNDVKRHSKRGMLSMASRGPNTNGSQFFFIYGEQPHLDNVNTCFGQIIWGTEVLDALENTPVDARDRPLHPVSILGFTIHANPFAEAVR